MTRAQDGKESFKVSGKRLPLSANSEKEKPWSFSVRPGGWIVAEKEGEPRRRLMIHEARGKLSASLGGKLWHGEVQRSERQSSAGGGGSDADLTAQFPGKVRKLLVQAGAVVVEGEPLLLVEAMKMEFAIKAPFAGTVARLLVQEGQQLTPGDRFVELIPSGGGSG